MAIMNNFNLTPFNSNASSHPSSVPVNTEGYAITEVSSSERGKFIFKVSEPFSITRRYYLHYVNATQLKLRCVRYKYACKATLKIRVLPEYINTQLVKNRRRFDIDGEYLLRPGTASELIVEAAHNEHICDDCENKDKLKGRKLAFSSPPSLVLNALEFDKSSN